MALNADLYVDRIDLARHAPAETCQICRVDSMEELLGRKPDLLNAEPDSDEIQKTIYQTVSSGKLWYGTILNRRKDGSIFPCENTIFPLIGE